MRFNTPEERERARLYGYMGDEADAVPSHPKHTGSPHTQNTFEAPRRAPFYRMEDDPNSHAFNRPEAPFTRVDPETGKEQEHESWIEPYTTADITGPRMQATMAREKDFQPPFPETAWGAKLDDVTLGDKIGIIPTIVSRLAPWMADPEHEEKAKGVSWSQAARNSLKSIDPIANIGNMLSMGGAGLKHGSPGAAMVGALAPSAAAGYATAASPKFARSIARDTANADAAIILGPKQARMAQKAGHIKRGDRSSAEALIEATALAERLPPRAAGAEFAEAVNRIYAETGWDTGSPLFKWPLTNLDSSNVRLKPQAIERGGSRLDKIGNPKPEPVSNLLTNVGKGSLFAAAAENDRVMVDKWSLGQPTRGRFEGDGIKIANAQTPEKLEMLLRHELIGHGTHGWPQYMDRPAHAPEASRSLLPGHYADQVQHFANYLAKPMEQYARLVESPFSFDPNTAPSQRDAWQVDSLHRREHDEPAWGFPFEEYGPAKTR